MMDKVPAKENDDEITFLKTVGRGVSDIVTARRMYEKALEKGAGKIITAFCIQFEEWVEGVKNIEFIQKSDKISI